jgi:hypothetical protein
VGIGRASDHIPRCARGISPQWWSENWQQTRPANKTLLRDWNKYPEPDGCGLVVERDDNGTIVDGHFSSGDEYSNWTTIFFRYVE